MAGGHIGACIHPSEFVTIGGAAGGRVDSSCAEEGAHRSDEGDPDLPERLAVQQAGVRRHVQVLYDLLRTARRDGMLALEPHVSKPDESTIFSKYPKVADEPSRGRFHLRRHGAADRRHGQAGADGRAAGSGAAR